MVSSGQTPDFSARGNFVATGNRVDEIWAWLDIYAADCESWIAIDDLNLVEMRPEKINPDYFVHTTEELGLTEELAEYAIKKLKATERA